MALQPAAVTEIVPDDYDIVITSTTDDEETVQRAVSNEPEPEADPEADPAATPETEPVVEKTAAPTAELDIEQAPQGETKDQRADRIERNVGRIHQLNAKVANKDQHIITLNEKIARLEGREEGRAGSGDASTTEPVTKPEAVFEFQTWDAWSEANPEKTHEEYTDARSDARFDYRKSIESKREARTTMDREQETVIAENTSRVDAFRNDHADFDAVMAAAGAVPMTDTMHMTFMRSEGGPAVAYHLAQPANLAEATRIAQLSPIDQVRAIATLEVQLGGTASPVAEKKPAAAADGTEIVPRRSPSRQTKAPAPLQVQTGSAGSSPDLENMETDAYIDEMDARDKRRGRRR